MNVDPTVLISLIYERALFSCGVFPHKHGLCPSYTPRSFSADAWRASIVAFCTPLFYFIGQSGLANGTARKMEPVNSLPPAWLLPYYICSFAVRSTKDKNTARSWAGKIAKLHFRTFRKACKGGAIAGIPLKKLLSPLWRPTQALQAQNQLRDVVT